MFCPGRWTGHYTDLLRESMAPKLDMQNHFTFCASLSVTNMIFIFWSKVSSLFQKSLADLKSTNKKPRLLGKLTALSIFCKCINVIVFLMCTNNIILNFDQELNLLSHATIVNINPFNLVFIISSPLPRRRGFHE